MEETTLKTPPVSTRPETARGVETKGGEKDVNEKGRVRFDVEREVRRPVEDESEVQFMD